MRRTLFFVLVLSALFFAACAAPQGAPGPGKAVLVDGGTYRDLTPLELQAVLQEKDFPLINVHIPYEGELPDTDLFIPYDQVEKLLSHLPQNKGAKMVLYCRSGAMSAIAARALVRLGYTNIWNLSGGMLEWQKQGYPLLRR